MNRFIILGTDWLKQFGVCMYYDLGCIRIGKSYVKVKEDIHIFALARLTANNSNQTTNRKVLSMHSQG